MILIAIGVGLVASFYAIHRLALWAERRGWIYYRDRKAPPGAAGMAFMELDRIWKPEIEHVIEEMRTGDHRTIIDEEDDEP